MFLHERRPVCAGLRQLVERNSRLFHFLVLFLVVHQVKGQFNLNPSSRGREPLENAPEDSHFVNQLQNHRITDDQHKPADQFVESHTIRVEESTHHAPPTIYNTNYNTNPTNPSTYNNPASTHSTYVTNQTPANYQTNGLTNPTLGSTVESTIGSSTSVVTVDGTATAGGAVENSMPSEAITKTQMGRLQSSTPPDSGQFASSPPGQFGNPNSRYGPQMAYSPNNPMGSPSLISSIFSKFNGGQMGSYYPYGNHPPNYPNYYGSSYGAGYPPSAYGSPYGGMGMGMGMGGNFLANAFYAKMRPIMSFFQRLTSKFHSPYNNPNYFYGGAYTNGVYNNFGNYGGKCDVLLNSQFPIIASIMTNSLLSSLLLTPRLMLHVNNEIYQTSNWTTHSPAHFNCINRTIDRT